MKNTIDNIKNSYTLETGPILVKDARSKLTWMTVPNEFVKTALNLVHKIEEDILSEEINGGFTTIKFK